MSNLISKYNISKKDLYTLGLIETQKQNCQTLEREKLKAASLKTLKPYNVKFLDLNNLLNEIKSGGYDLKYAELISDEEKIRIEKQIIENSNISNFYKDWWGGKTSKQKLIIGAVAISVLVLISVISDTKVDPCDCADVGSKAQMIGYHNLTSTQQSLFNDCEKKYTSSGAAYDACVNKHLSK